MRERGSGRLAAAGAALSGVAALVVGVIALAGVHRLERRERAAAPPVADAESSDADVWEELRRLKGEVASLRLSLAAVAADQKSPVASGAAAAEATVASAPTAETSAPEDADDAFRREPIDSAWARTAAATLSSAFVEEGANVLVGSTECRSRTCRMEIKEKDSVDPAYLRVARQVVQHFSSLMAMKSSASSEAGAMTVYFTRSPASSEAGL